MKNEHAVALRTLPLLQAQGIVSHYGPIRALHGVDVQVGQGEIVAIVGANGAGKTTLLRVFSGVQPLSAGSLTYDGRPVSAWAPSARVKAGICQVPEGRQMFGPMSVEDNLKLGGYTRKSAEAEGTIDEIYRMFPVLREKRRLPAGTLSGGQQQMLAIGRALMARPRLLLLDEPSMGLAPLIVGEILEAIRGLRDRGLSILLVEQNAHAALKMADRGYVLESGRVTLQGLASSLLQDDSVRRAYLGLADD